MGALREMYLQCLETFQSIQPVTGNGSQVVLIKVGRGEGGRGGSGCTEGGVLTMFGDFSVHTASYCW